METKIILILFVLNIGLPTLDTVTDINLVVKLYRGAHYCGTAPVDPNYDEFWKCYEDPASYCSNEENNQAVCHLYRGDHFCLLANYDDYEKCDKDPASYCSNDENNHNICQFSSHYKMATAMLTPFLLNYIVCFITFLRKEKNKKFTFIFALLNIYPQFGENNHQEKSLE